MELRTGGTVTAVMIPLIIRQTYRLASPADSLIGTERADITEPGETVLPKQVPLYFISPNPDPRMSRERRGWRRRSQRGRINK